MKILLVNTYSSGGAALACIRLHNGLLANGIESNVLLLKKNTKEEITHYAEFSGNAEKRNERIFPSKNFPFFNTPQKIRTDIRNRPASEIEWFSFADSGLDITTHPFYKEADLINMHWVSDFVDYDFFQKNTKPVVWTLHDMNAFTGGCHYSGSCTAYRENCPQCPQLKNTIAPRYSSRIWKYKNEGLKSAYNLSIVALSNWLKHCSQSSSLFKGKDHYLIPNGMNSQLFSPVDKIRARNELNLPLDKKIMLFVAYKTLHIPRKGYAILLEAISSLNRADVLLCSVGGAQKSEHDNTSIIDFGFVSDERKMSLLYSAADFFVIPSTEDNLPNTVMESLLCGTPVLGFRAGGVPDMVKPGLNGLLAESISAGALLQSIHEMLDYPNGFDRNAIREDAVARYDQDVQAKNYIQLFQEILNRK